MPVEGAGLRIHHRVVHFFFQPAGGRAFNGRTSDFTVDIAYNQFVVGDKNGLFFQIIPVEISAL